MRVLGIKPLSTASTSSGPNHLAISLTPHVTVSNLEACLQTQTTMVNQSAVSYPVSLCCEFSMTQHLQFLAIHLVYACALYLYGFQNLWKLPFAFEMLIL